MRWNWNAVKHASAKIELKEIFIKSSMVNGKQNDVNLILKTKGSQVKF